MGHIELKTLYYNLFLSLQNNNNNNGCAWTYHVFFLISFRLYAIFNKYAIFFF